MAINVRELTLAVNTNVERPNWCLNATSGDASGGETIKAAVAKRHAVDKITVVYKSAGTNWFKLLDGTNELVGPLTFADGVPYTFTFQRSIFGTASTNLKIKTQAAGDICVVVEGFTEL